MTPSQKRNNNRSFVVKQLALLINFEKKNQYSIQL